MDIVQTVFESLRWCDTNYDLSVVYVVLCLLCVITALFAMQWITAGAGFRSPAALGFLLVRVMLIGLIAAMLISAGMALYPDYRPWTIDIVERFFILGLLLFVPKLMGGRAGAEAIASTGTAGG